MASKNKQLYPDEASSVGGTLRKSDATHLNWLSNHRSVSIVPKIIMSLAMLAIMIGTSQVSAQIDNSQMASESYSDNPNRDLKIDEQI